jgi:hypothetical protein
VVQISDGFFFFNDISPDQAVQHIWHLLLRATSQHLRVLVQQHAPEQFVWETDQSCFVETKRMSK